MRPLWIPFSMEEEGERVPLEGVEGKHGEKLSSSSWESGEGKHGEKLSSSWEGGEVKRGKKICEVCGAPSLGHNFGAVSCESCKAFFRRNAFRLQVVANHLCTLLCYISWSPGYRHPNINIREINWLGNQLEPPLLE